jgi:hypothetical protein
MQDVFLNLLIGEPLLGLCFGDELAESFQKWHEEWERQLGEKSLQQENGRQRSAGGQ